MANDKARCYDCNEDRADTEECPECGAEICEACRPQHVKACCPEKA